jgi:hypothetical protein
MLFICDEMNDVYAALHKPFFLTSFFDNVLSLGHHQIDRNSYNYCMCH